MRNSLRTLLGALSLAALLAAPAAAQAAPWQWAVTTTDVNLRAGPSVRYPAVTTVYEGARVQLFGCLRGWDWCDVAWHGIRGWMAGDYLEVAYGGRRYDVPDVGVSIGVPFIQFDLGDYWDDYYRDRPWYREWRHRPHRDWDDHRWDNRNSGDRWDNRWDSRDRDRRDWSDGDRTGNDGWRRDDGDRHHDRDRQGYFPPSPPSPLRNGVPMQGKTFAPSGGKDADGDHGRKWDGTGKWQGSGNSDCRPGQDCDKPRYRQNGVPMQGGSYAPD